MALPTLSVTSTGDRHTVMNDLRQQICTALGVSKPPNDVENVLRGAMNQAEGLGTNPVTVSIDMTPTSSTSSAA